MDPKLAACLDELSMRLHAAADAPELELRETCSATAKKLKELAELGQPTVPISVTLSFEESFPAHSSNKHPVTCLHAIDVARIISGSEGGLLKLWAMSGKGLVEVEGHTDAIVAIGSAPADCIVSASRDRTLKIWNMDLQCLQVAQRMPRGLTCGATQANLLALGAKDHCIHIWNLQTLEPVACWKGHTDAVLCICNGIPGFISGGSDRTIKLWNSAGSHKSLEGHSGAVSCLAACGDYIASGSKDKYIKIWDSNSSQCVATFCGHLSYVRSILFLHPTRVVSASSDRTLRIWDVAAQACLAQLEGHSDSVVSVESVGEHLVSASDDCTLKVWRPARCPGLTCDETSS